jgi:hypothetical protein
VQARMKLPSGLRSYGCTAPLPGGTHGRGPSSKPNIAVLPNALRLQRASHVSGTTARYSRRPDKSIGFAEVVALPSPRSAD